MLLYRPVGLAELLLLFDADAQAFPPRLPEQPIFYPVLSLDYAAQIAREWNTTEATLAGYVTRFSVEDAYAHSFAPQIVGSSAHRELWVPSEELDAFNAHIEGRIEVVDAYFGAGFVGARGTEGSLAGLDATAQLATLHSLANGPSDGPRLVDREVRSNARSVYAHFAFWQTGDFTDIGLSRETRDALLSTVRAAWDSQSDIPLARRAPW